MWDGHVGLPTAVQQVEPLTETCARIICVSFQVAIAEFRCRQTFWTLKRLHMDPYSATTAICLACAPDVTLNRQ